MAIVNMPTMYAHLPTADVTVEKARYYRTPDGQRAMNQPGVPLEYQTGFLATCQHCGRRAIFQSVRVVSERDDRIPGGLRYFHASVEGPRFTLCDDCYQRDAAVQP